MTRRRSRSRSTPATGPQRGQDEVGELLAIADEIIRHAEASAELELALQGHSWRLVDLLELGQTETIDDEIAACASLADRLAQPFYRSWVAGLHPMRALMQGRFDEAERLAREALAAAEAAGNWNGITSSRVQLGWCWKDVGRGAERAAEVERFVQDEVLTRPLSGGAAAVWNGNLALFMAEAGLDARARRLPRPRRRLRRRRADGERRRAQRRGARRRSLRAARR